MLEKEKLTKSTSKKTSKLGDKTPKDPAFAERLKTKRKELGLNQEILAKMAGVSNTTLQNYESGQYPKGEHAIALAQALTCSLDWLLIGKEEESATVAHLKERLAELEAENMKLEQENKALLREANASHKEALRVYRLAFPHDDGLKGESTITVAPASAPSAPSCGHNAS